MLANETSAVVALNNGSASNTACIPVGGVFTDGTQLQDALTRRAPTRSAAERCRSRWRRGPEWCCCHRRSTWISDSAERVDHDHPVGQRLRLDQLDSSHREPECNRFGQRRGAASLLDQQRNGHGSRRQFGLDAVDSAGVLQCGTARDRQRWQHQRAGDGERSAST